MNNDPELLAKLFPTADDVETHLTQDELNRYVAGAIDSEERSCIEFHLSLCPLCAFDVTDLSKQNALHAREAERAHSSTDRIRTRQPFLRFLMPALCGAAFVALAGLVFIDRLSPRGGEVVRLAKLNSALQSENEKLRDRSGSAADAKLLRDFAYSIAPIVAQAGGADEGGKPGTATPGLVIVPGSKFTLRWRYEPGEAHTCTVRIIDAGDMRNVVIAGQRVSDDFLEISLPSSGKSLWKKYRWDLKFSSGRPSFGYLVQISGESSVSPDQVKSP